VTRGYAAAVLRGDLGPVGRRNVWIAWGLAIQAIGCAIPVVVAFNRARRDGLTGHITRATVPLIWHEMAHNHHDLGLIVLGVVLFVAGSVILARPFTRRTVTLMVTVPLAALAGIVVLGVVALVIAAAIASFDSWDLDLATSGEGGGSRQTRQRRRRLRDRLRA
jgi:hypothetical protein